MGYNVPNICCKSAALRLLCMQLFTHNDIQPLGTGTEYHLCMLQNMLILCGRKPPTEQQLSPVMLTEINWGHTTLPQKTNNLAYTKL